MRKERFFDGMKYVCCVVAVIAAALVAAIIVTLVVDAIHASTVTTVTLYDTDTLRIEKEGAETRIYDLAGNEDYTFTKQRVRRVKDSSTPATEPQPKDTPRLCADTDTIKLETVHSIIIITDKTAGSTYYIS